MSNNSASTAAASSAKKQTTLRRLRNQINPLLRRTHQYFHGPQSSAISTNDKMSSNSASAATEIYIYMGHETVPKNVTRVTIQESVTVIPKNTFRDCHDLKEVVLPEGLKEIRYGAFSFCTSMEDINFPSTLSDIGCEAFKNCYSLARVEFSEGLHCMMIGPMAFYGCRSIKHLKVPYTASTIRHQAFKGCWALKDVQLCDRLTIESGAFSQCYSLLSINIPSSVTRIGRLAFSECDFLKNVAIASEFTLEEEELEQSHLLHNLHPVGCSLDLAKGRFDDLPIHRLCFYQTESAILLEKVKTHATKENLTQVDCLGMTPLHILACSGRHDIGVYKFFVGECPEALLIKCKWDKTPLAYAILSEAPREIIHFLFEKHSKSLNGVFPFDFQAMVETLANRLGTSAEFLRSTIQAQRTHFPTLEIEWERIVNENVEGKMHVKVFFVLVEASISKRLNCMSSEHQITIKNVINEVNAIWKEMETVDGQRIINCIRDYAMLYREFLKEATTLLELALWKFAINELENDQESNEGGNPCGNGAVIVHSESRRQCRFKCNTEDIFPIILSFL